MGNVRFDAASRQGPRQRPPTRDQQSTERAAAAAEDRAKRARAALKKAKKESKKAGKAARKARKAANAAGRGRHEGSGARATGGIQSGKDQTHGCQKSRA